MQSVQARTIYNREISEPFPVNYDPDLPLSELSSRIQNLFGKSVVHFIQVGEILKKETIAKEAIKEKGFLFCILN